MVSHVEKGLFGPRVANELFFHGLIMVSRWSTYHGTIDSGPSMSMVAKIGKKTESFTFPRQQMRSYRDDPSLVLIRESQGTVDPLFFALSLYARVPCVLCIDIFRNKLISRGKNIAC